MAAPALIHNPAVFIPSAPHRDQLSNVPDPSAPLTEAQKYQIIPPSQPWGNQYALSIVRPSFEYMAQWRQQSGHDRRFAEADELYCGYRPRKNWEGTKKPRASIPVLLLLSMLQSLLPNVMQALFPIEENIEITPRPGSSMESVQAVYDLITAQLSALGMEGTTRFRTTAMEAFTQGFLYGAGVVEIGWFYRVIERLVASIDWVTPHRPTFDPTNGGLAMMPAGPPQRVVRESVQKLQWNQPDLMTRDIRAIYVDPSAQNPSFQHPTMRFCAHRDFPTIGELITYRGQPGFDIPDDYTLIKLAENKTSMAEDQYKRISASTAGYQWNPLEDYSDDPYQKRVERVRWFSRERCVWMFNRTWIGYNWANPMHSLPFLNIFYVPFPNRFHGLSLADLTEGDQHLIASLLESRMDDLSLTLNSPFLARQGTMIQGQNLFTYPGKVIYTSDEPQKSFMRLESQGQTQNAFIEVNDAYARSSRTTGMSDLVVMGVPQAGGNSANRTATGVDRQAQAVGMRLQFLVENAESSFIEPLLTMMHQYNVKFLPRNQMIPILGPPGPDGGQLVLDPVQVLNANPNFVMRAAARMRSRSQLMQVLPWLVQVVMNPELLQMFGQQQQQTLDVKVLMQLITDTLNVPRFNLFRPMTQQEIQASQQPDPQSTMQLQLQRERLSAMGELQSDRDESKMAIAMLNNILTPRVAEHITGFGDSTDTQHKLDMVKAVLQYHAAMNRPRPSNGGSQ